MTHAFFPVFVIKLRSICTEFMKRKNENPNDDTALRMSALPKGNNIFLYTSNGPVGIDGPSRKPA